MGTRRLFVGLAPEEGTARELHAAAERALDPERWRLYAARDIHLTLCFLGAVAEELVGPLEKALGEALAELPAPRLEITGLGAFPDPGHPRVVWAGVRGAGEAVVALRELERLHDLARVAGRAIVSAGAAFDTRDFTPHLTLARPVRGRSGATPWSHTSARAFEQVWPWRPEAVLLFESGGGGAVSPAGKYPRRVVARLGDAT